MINMNIIENMLDDIDEKYRCHIGISKFGKGVRYSYSIMVDYGIVEFWFIKTKITSVYGGVERHYKEKPDYFESDSPSHNFCQLLGAPCWHDGSSLAFDRFEPYLKDPNKLFHMYLK